MRLKKGYTYRKLWGYTEENDPLEQWIVSLTMHEVGHTLGLRHNFKSSWVYDAKEVHDVSITGDNHIGSVMDYDPINLAPEGIPQGNFFPTGPGFYDIWAIEFGYTPSSLMRNVKTFFQNRLSQNIYLELMEMQCHRQV